MGLDPRRRQFVQRMRTPPGDAMEFRSGTLQTLMMMNGQLMDDLTAHDRSSVLGALSAPYLDEADQVEAVFFATLSRPPSVEQQAACVELLQACETKAERRRALGDIVWALVNSSEFGFNR